MLEGGYSDYFGNKFLAFFYLNPIVDSALNTQPAVDSAVNVKPAVISAVNAEPVVDPAVNFCCDRRPKMTHLIHANITVKFDNPC